MTLERKTVLDLIAPKEDGTVEVRMQKQTVLDGEVLQAQFHRTIVDPLGDVDEQFGLVNTHLAQMGFGPVSTAEIGVVRDTAAAVRAFPDVAARIAAIKARREAEEAEGNATADAGEPT
ncbi:hypothetical protein [Mesorhizobium sp. CA16]|uniref:hypothetical protein n=1 Tax=Mesorhizobium sp. CA16 TaxID=588496 RepID=UPI001CCB3C77|nr:hypothetical protein [Mesorhizobium sp. CA16]MBZ9912678.1 hypothetical protein [Mesorhizobium sp. CA16]